MRYLALVLCACGGPLSVDAGVPDSGEDAGPGAPAYVEIQYMYYSAPPSQTNCEPESQLTTCATHTFDDGGLSRWTRIYGDAGCLVDVEPGAVTFDCRRLCRYYDAGRADLGECCGQGVQYRVPFTPIDACQWSPP